ncbi:RNA 2',3'-cyclic phosphodiesterase [Azohydromonas caseinilytica]|uniref:RNA 2',3'-cyclic phosphodiesterase n=1 Tax=Azohydromonas caseinilytica TaxID=2728836 RepID=A0A848F7R0_9BURK|nr:RNA 2',3'-cyclic phosphodiesterase [Azohydromonas caseinilytica]NML14081.1 RNA 2',3'-cyclic phosphodiesterase [Azohydromonas caseinilytica]
MTTPDATAVLSDNNSTPNAAMARLFIGLWPDDAQRWEARAHQQLWRWPPQARTTPASKLHLTLHFIGEVPQAQVEPLVQAMPASFAAAELTLSQPSLWRGGIAVLEPDTVPASLQALHAQLGLRLRQLGVSLEAKPWRPHLTLARQAQGAKPPVAPPPLHWRLAQLALVQSDGGFYKVLRTAEAV